MASAADPRKLEDSPSQQETLRSFFWDSVVLYVAFVIIGIAAVDTVIQFVQNITISCNAPDTANVSAEYINYYCYRETSFNRYITIFNVAIGTLIAAPHYLWLNIAAGKFAFFLVVTKDMDPKPNPKTGNWSEENNVIVEQVKHVYLRQHFVLVAYIVKEIIQLLFTVLGLLIAILIFNNANSNFYCPRTFNSSTIPNFWPLNHQVECTFVTLDTLNIVRWIDIAFLAVIMLGLILGGINCLLFSKTMNESSESAKFFLQSTLPYEFYASGLLRSPTLIKSDLDFLVTGLFRGEGDVATSFWRILRHKKKKDFEFKEVAMASIDLREKATDENLDLQLLLPQTSGADLLSVLKSSPEDKHCFPLQCSKRAEIKSVTCKATTEEEEPIYLASPLDLYRVTQNNQVILEADVRGAVLSFAAFCPRREVAVVFEYGKASKCVPLALTRAFKRVILVNFQYRYKNYDKYVTTWEFPLVNYSEMTLHPYVVLNQNPDQYKEFTAAIKKIWKGQPPAPATSDLKVSMKFDPTTVKLQDEVKVKVSGAAPPTEQAPPTEPALFPESDFIVISPIQKEKEYQVSATTLFLENLANEGCLSDRALLLSVYPLTVGGRLVWGRKVQNCFSWYRPPDQQKGVNFQFQHCECQHRTDTTKQNSSYINLDECCKSNQDPGWCSHDLHLKCGEVPCKFKFSLYKRSKPAVEQEAEDKL